MRYKYDHLWLFAENSTSATQSVLDRCLWAWERQVLWRKVACSLPSSSKCSCPRCCSPTFWLWDWGECQHTHTHKDLNQLYLQDLIKRLLLFCCLNIWMPIALKWFVNNCILTDTDIILVGFHCKNATKWDFFFLRKDVANPVILDSNIKKKINYFAK